MRESQSIACRIRGCTIKERLRVYHEQTEPLKDYYYATGKLFVVEGQEEVADTTALTLKAVNAEA